MVASEHRKDGSPEDGCPAFGGTFYTSPLAASALHQSKENPTKAYGVSSSTPKDVAIDTASPPSPRLLEILEGANAPGDSENAPNPPPWLDKKLFEHGRQFCRRYIFCLCFSELLTLAGSLSIERAVKPLIFTGRSDSPQKAMNRYSSTLLHLLTWYSGDVWNPSDPAHKDVLLVRSVHKKVAKIFNSPYNNQRVTNIKVTDRGYEEPKCPLYPSIKKDFEAVVEGNLETKNSNDSPHYISQMDMSFTQHSFMGLLLAHPEKLGAGAATEEDFAGFIHYWRGVGWLLGIEDKYNFCNGSVAETRSLCLEVEHLVIIPSLAKAEWNYEYMTKSLMSGINTVLPFMTFPTMFRYLAYVMDVPSPMFTRQMSFRHTLYYWILRIVFALILIIPGIVLFLNNSFEAFVEKCKMNHAKAIEAKT